MLDELTGDLLGTIDGILLQPDTGKIEGFFVRGPGVFPGDTQFLRSSDIARFGKRVEVRDSDCLGPIHDHIRLEHLLADPRRILGQSMQTERGARLGRCQDIQFDTTTFHLQWLFPKKFRFFWSTPVPANAVLEVKPHAIIIREQVVTVPTTEEVVATELVPTPPTPA